MNHARALLRFPALGLVTALVYLAWVLSRPLGWLSFDLGRRTHFFFVRTWARAFAWILGVRLEVRGAPRPAPFFLVSNHLSYLDIVVLFSVVDCFFLAKSEVAHWPILGFLARSTGTLFIDRGKRSDVARAIEEIRRILDSGAGVVVFPEGTSTRGASVIPFKASMFEVAIRTDHPVSIASLSYKTPEGAPPAHLAVCWWGDMTFLKHCYELVGLPSIRAEVTFAAETVSAPDRKTLARTAHRAVEKIFTPVVGCGA